MAPEPACRNPAQRDRQRHDLMTTLTQMRLQTQHLLRLVQRQEPPDQARLRTGLTKIDEDISTLVHQLEQYEQS